MALDVKIVGIINVTPDSFSDGGQVLGVGDARKRALAMLDAGADVIEIGGDSTRPGSVCVGEEEEWARIGAIVEDLAPSHFISVDTHNASVAKRAVSFGVKMINDVSGGDDPEMFSVIASSECMYVLMFSRCHPPHCFLAQGSEDVVQAASDFFEERIEFALSAGILRSQIVLDPGMGAFLSDRKDDSWKMISRLSELSQLGYPLMLGASRKGFLKQEDESSIYDRDSLSALCGCLCANSLPEEAQLFLRVHDVLMQRRFLDVLESFQRSATSLAGC